MNKKRTLKSLLIVIIAVLLGGMIILAGFDRFLEFPAILLLWLAVGYGAAALAHLIAMLVYLLTKKDLLNMLRLLCPGLLMLISIGWAIHESRRFMGNIGAAVIEAMFTLPLGAAFLFRLIAAILRMRKRVKEPLHTDSE